MAEAVATIEVYHACLACGEPLAGPTVVRYIEAGLPATAILTCAGFQRPPCAPRPLLTFVHPHHLN